jgi:biotin carboxyl carrier protein
MKVRVRVEGRTFEVEVGDLASLPISAVVDGRRFEVWPSGEAVSQGVAPAQAGPPAAGESPGSTSAAPSLRTVRAPIPGVIESIAVREGARVARGDELVVLEAMKMKNSIRAPRAGVIAAIHVTAGQHVNHDDPLVDYGD